MKVWKVSTAATILSTLVGSTALAQEMGGAIGPGSAYGYEPEPAPTHDDRAYPERGFVPFASNAGSYARMEQSDGSCGMRYRSQKPRSRTFMGNDGRRRPC
jgi:hypothetical protein